jgi:hypothetical protein
MNHPSNRPEKGRHILMSFGLALVLFGCCGCAAHLATVKTKTPRLSATVASEAYLSPATECLAAAENEQPPSALGHDLLAARISSNVLARLPDNESARNIYNFAAARIAQDTARAVIQPASRIIRAVAGDPAFESLQLLACVCPHCGMLVTSRLSRCSQCGNHTFEGYLTVAALKKIGDEAPIQRRIGPETYPLRTAIRCGEEMLATKQ